jgi:hypothetical protein
MENSGIFITKKKTMELITGATFVKCYTKAAVVPHYVFML